MASTTSAAVASVDVLANRNPRLAWLALGAVLTGTLTGTLGNSMANVALPSVMNTFNVPVGDVLWVVTIYILMFSVPMPVFGRLGDLYGYKRLYLASLSLFALFSLLAGLSTSFPLLIVFRALQGLANAPTLPAVMGIAALLFPPEQRGQAIGMWAFANSASHAVGPPLSGFIVQVWGWPAIFFVLVPLSVVGVFLVAYLIPDDHRHRIGGFDYAGAGCFMLAMLGLMVVLTQGPKAGWDSAPVVAGGFAFVVMMLLLVLIERCVTVPFIDARLFKIRAYAAATWVISLQVLLQFGLALILPLYLVRIQGQSSTLTGLVVFSLPMTMALVAPFAGRLADERGNKLVAVVGMLIVAVGASFLLTLGATTPALIPMAMLIAIGVGMGFVQSPTAACVTQVAPHEKLGVALGLYNMIRFMGGMLGTILFGILLDVTAPQLGLTGAFRFDFGLVVVLGGLAALFSFSLPGKHAIATNPISATYTLQEK